MRSGHRQQVQHARVVRRGLHQVGQALRAPWPAPPSGIDQRGGIANLHVAAGLRSRGDRLGVGGRGLFPLVLALVELTERRPVARIDLRRGQQRRAGFIDPAQRGLRFGDRISGSAAHGTCCATFSRIGTATSALPARSCSRPSVICRFGFVAINGVFWIA